MTWRLRAALAAIAAAAAAAGVGSLAHGGSRAVRRTVAASIEPVSAAALAAGGGVVTEVLARPGDRVVKDQVLVRFDSAALIAERARLSAALDTARNLSALPRAASMLAVDAHAEVLAAEERYTRALAAFEQAPPAVRAAASAALERAAANRTETRRRIGAGLARATGRMGAASATLESLLGELDRAIAGREVRAPAAGVIEILGLHPGDRVPPTAPVALVTLPGEYTCEFTVADASGLRPGASLPVHAAGGLRTAGRVESVVIPPASRLRADLAAAAETVVRIRFTSVSPLTPGAAVELELP